MTWRRVKRDKQIGRHHRRVGERLVEEIADGGQDVEQGARVQALLAVLRAEPAATRRAWPLSSNEASEKPIEKVCTLVRRPRASAASAATRGGIDAARQEDAHRHVGDQAPADGVAASSSRRRAAASSSPAGGALAGKRQVPVAVDARCEPRPAASVSSRKRSPGPACAPRGRCCAAAARTRARGSGPSASWSMLRSKPGRVSKALQLGRHGEERRRPSRAMLAK